VLHLIIRLEQASQHPKQRSTRYIFNSVYNGKGEVTYFSAINFQGRFIWQLSCYTLTIEYRLPWPSYSCFNEMTPFLVSDEYVIRHFSLLLTVHSTLSDLLTKTDPLRADNRPLCSIEQHSGLGTFRV